jgi:hypothetical protein
VVDGSGTATLSQVAVHRKIAQDGGLTDGGVLQEPQIFYTITTTDELTDEVTTETEDGTVFDGLVAGTTDSRVWVSDDGLTKVWTEKLTGPTGAWTQWTVNTLEFLAGAAAVQSDFTDASGAVTTTIKMASADVSEFHAMDAGVSSVTTVYAFASLYLLPPNNYTGAALAAQLQSLLTGLVDFPAPTVTFDEGTGKVTFTAADDQHTLLIPSSEEIRRASWYDGVWNQFWSASPYHVDDPRDFNASMNWRPPAQFGATLTSGVVDLAVLREVYLHSSLTNFRTMTSVGQKDCVARIPIDVGYGDIVSYRHFGTDSDAIPCNEMAFRNVRFSLRDAYGRLVPLDGYIALELCFTETLPTM